MASNPTTKPWIVAVIASMMAWLLWLSGVTRPFDQAISDVILELPAPPIQAEAPFAAVVIDDDSVAGGGPPPWPRGQIAELIDAIVDHGARAIVVDMLLSDPGNPDDDGALERSLTNVQAVLAAVIGPRGTWILPLDRFGGAGRAAHAHAEIGSDGVVREISTTKQAQGLSLPALSVAASGFAGWRGPIEPGRSIRPDFRHALRTVPTIPAQKLLRADPSTPLVAGRVVFVGYTAAGAGDRYVVPAGLHGQTTPGVLMHAGAAAAIFNDMLLKEPPAWLVLSICLVGATAAQLLRSRLGRLSALWLIALLGAIAVFTLTLYWIGDLQLPMMTFWVAVLISVAGREAAESLDAQRETDAVLRSLLEQRPSTLEIPRGVGSRLQLARSLQRSIARDGELRKALLDGLKEGVVLWNDAGDPVLANRSAAELLGHVPSADDIPLPPGDDGRTPAEIGTEVVHDGRHLEVETRAIESGRLGLFRDVTARRELERSRREMQRMVSHELKTPLSSISGFGSMIETYELSRDEQVRVAGMIRREAERLADMVRTFLDLERLGAVNANNLSDDVDLRKLAVERCEVLRAAVVDSRKTLHVEGTEPCPVQGSVDLLVRVMDNLVGNAIKYCPAGSTIRVTTRCDGTTGSLEVADDGPGIDPEAVPYLFDRFYRVPGGHSSGSGLGLALVKEIAEHHGGSVHVSSEIGRGTTFTVELPTAPRGGEKP